MSRSYVTRLALEHLTADGPRNRRRLERLVGHYSAVYGYAREEQSLVARAEEEYSRRFGRGLD